MLEFTIQNKQRIFDELTSTDAELKQRFERYVYEEHIDDSELKYNYPDIAEIGSYIFEKFKDGQTQNFVVFFIVVENILKRCDEEIQNLIVVGLFESIQNLCGSNKLDYYFGFNPWLKQLSLIKWQNLIDYWEGPEWRNRTK